MRADQTGDQSNNLKEGDTGSKKVTPYLTLSPELPPLLFTINRLYPERTFMPYKEPEMRKRFARESMQRLRGERRYNQILRMLDTLKKVYGKDTLRYLGAEQVCSLMRGLHFTQDDLAVIEKLLRV